MFVLVVRVLSVESIKHGADRPSHLIHQDQEVVVPFSLFHSSIIIMPFNPEKLAKLVGKGSTGAAAAPANVRTGGKGTVRRKHKAVRKTATHDDKRLKATLNKLSVRDIPAIEEVNLFKDDGHVIHFVNPKVQASIAANTYVISGSAETKKLQDLLPGIITQLGPDNLEDLKRIYSSFAGKEGGAGLPDIETVLKQGQAATGADDDDVPELVENFEEVSKKDQTE